MRWGGGEGEGEDVMGRGVVGGMGRGREEKNEGREGVRWER